MKYPAILHCDCSPTAILNAKYATQGAADQAVELFRAIHGKVDCVVMSGLPPKQKVEGGGKRSTAASDRKDKYVYDDEYHAR